MVCTTDCRGISAQVPGAPPSALTLVSAELFLLHILTLFSGCCAAFLPFLKHVIKEELSALLMGLAVSNCGSLLELSGSGPV